MNPSGSAGSPTESTGLPHVASLALWSSQTWRPALPAELLSWDYEEVLNPGQHKQIKIDWCMNSTMP